MIIKKEKALKRYYDIYNYFLKTEDSNRYKHCFDYKDILSTQNGQTSVLLSIEGGAALNGDLKKLFDVYEHGIRMMTLTWNSENEIAGGVANNNFGLSSFGKEVINNMNELNMIIDVSHLNDKSFFDVISTTKKPVIASHSNCRSICNHPRNLTDEQIKIITDQNGLIGLNLYPLFISLIEDKAEHDDLFRHIDRFLHLGCEKTLAFGSDFDGAPMDIKWNNIESIPNLRDRILNEFGKEVCESIFYTNANNFFAENL